MLVSRNFASLKKKKHTKYLWGCKKNDAFVYLQCGFGIFNSRNESWGKVYQFNQSYLGVHPVLNLTVCKQLCVLLHWAKLQIHMKEPLAWIRFRLPFFVLFCEELNIFFLFYGYCFNKMILMTFFASAYFLTLKNKSKAT